MSSSVQPTRIRLPHEPVTVGYCRWCGAFTGAGRENTHRPEDCRESLYVTLCDMQTVQDHTHEAIKLLMEENAALRRALDGAEELNRRGLKWEKNTLPAMFRGEVE